MRLEGFSKLLAWAVFLSALSCSSADPPAPPQGCQDFIDIWCNKNAECRPPSDRARSVEEDRKSTRLNSSHVRISYAVFCLKKKKNKQHASRTSTQETQQTKTP